jgi:transposase
MIGKYLDERIARVTDKIETLARADEAASVCHGSRDRPIISSAMVAAIGSGAAFAKGRDFAAWPAALRRPARRCPRP